MRFLWVGLVATLLVWAPAALAAPSTIDLQVPLPLTLAGTASGSGHGDLVVAGSQGSLGFVLDQATGSATLVIHRGYGLDRPQSPAQILWQDPVERQAVDLTGASLSVAARTPAFQALAYDVPLKVASPSLFVGQLSDPLTVDSQVAPPLSVVVAQGDDTPFSHVTPAGLLESRVVDGTADASEVQLFLSGADLTWTTPTGTQTLPIHPHTDQVPGGLYDPLSHRWTGPGWHREYVQEYLIFSGPAHLHVDLSGTPAFAYTPSLDLSGRGSLDAQRATGSVAVQEGSQTSHHDLAGVDVHLEGAYTLHLAPSAGGYELSGTGDLTAIRYGSVAATYAWGAVAAVGLGAAVAAGAAWILWHGKLVGGGAALAGYARVHGEEILQHPGRAEVYELVKATPGIGFHEIAGALAVGASTLTYHLRVLERNGYVTSLKDGRYLRFFDRRSGAYARERKNAVSALRNANSAAIANHIRQNPGVAQSELAQRFEITASTVSWHVRRLSQVGLVDAHRSPTHTRYYAGEAWATLPSLETPPVTV
ncbi:MAG: winged helix-turn-helix transcriptional regulator [Thermoplasmatota archaeon]